MKFHSLFLESRLCYYSPESYHENDTLAEPQKVSENAVASRENLYHAQQEGLEKTVQEQATHIQELQAQNNAQQQMLESHAKQIAQLRQDQIANGIRNSGASAETGSRFLKKFFPDTPDFSQYDPKDFSIKINSDNSESAFGGVKQGFFENGKYGEDFNAPKGAILYRDSVGNIFSNGQSADTASQNINTGSNGASQNSGNTTRMVTENTSAYNTPASYPQYDATGGGGAQVVGDVVGAVGLGVGGAAAVNGLSPNNTGYYRYGDSSSASNTPETSESKPEEKPEDATQNEKTEVEKEKFIFTDAENLVTKLKEEKDWSGNKEKIIQGLSEMTQLKDLGIDSSKIILEKGKGNNSEIITIPVTIEEKEYTIRIGKNEKSDETDTFAMGLFLGEENISISSFKKEDIEKSAKKVEEQAKKTKETAETQTASTKELQTELQKLGFTKGGTDGKLGPNSRKDFTEFSTKYSSWFGPDGNGLTLPATPDSNGDKIVTKEAINAVKVIVATNEAIKALTSLSTIEGNTWKIYSGYTDKSSESGFLPISDTQYHFHTSQYEGMTDNFGENAIGIALKQGEKYYNLIVDTSSGEMKFGEKGKESTVESSSANNLSNILNAIPSESTEVLDTPSSGVSPAANMTSPGPNGS